MYKSELGSAIEGKNDGILINLIDDRQLHIFDLYQNLYINSILFYNDPPPPPASIIDSSIDTARISLKSSDTETVNSILHKLTKESQISSDIESSIPTGIALKPEIVSHKYLIAANVLL